MIYRAVEQRWPITAEQRKAAVEKLASILADQSSSERAVLAAVKALIAMEAQNQKDEHAGPSEPLDNDRLASIAAEIGIDPDQLFNSKN